MVRSFPTRFPNSLTRTVLLVPCLLICLSCATPFPIESLEKGMTAETARENFGAPEAIETKPEGVDTSWSYVHEELEIGAAIIGWPWAPLFMAISVFGDFEDWDAPYMITSDVVLYFEDERLARWEVNEPVPSVSSGSNWQPQQWNWNTDAAHHAKGHKHHHGHGC